MFARVSFKFFPRTGYLQRWFHKGQILKSTVEVRMPSLSPTMTQGNIVKWHKKEGDQISPGDMLCEIQTDKAVMAFEIEEEGTLAKILKGDNTNEVAVGTLIALIADEGTDWKSIKIPEDVVQESSQKPQIQAPIETHSVKRSHALGPAAKILLQRYNINANKVEATGPRGILLKSDVMKYIKEKDLKPVQVDQTYAKPPMAAPKVALSESLPFDISSSQMLVDQSKINYKKLPIPHSYSSIDICMDAVERCCKEFIKDGINVEYLDILIKAAAISLKKFPHLNAMWSNDSIQMLRNANVSFSFDVDESHIFQEIEDAASLTVSQISSKIKEFKEKAISKELPDLAVSRSSLLISYLGNVDITSYHSVVIPPCVSCLSFVAPRFILNEDCAKILKTTISMSFDSRVVDDVDATNFLENIKQLLENPSLMISQHTTLIDMQKLFAK